MTEPRGSPKELSVARSSRARTTREDEVIRRYNPVSDQDKMSDVDNLSIDDYRT